jgi:hypothetical protein
MTRDTDTVHRCTLPDKPAFAEFLDDYADNYKTITGEHAENYIRKRAEVDSQLCS